MQTAPRSPCLTFCLGEAGKEGLEANFDYSVREMRGTGGSALIDVLKDILFTVMCCEELARVR